jgi:hypothetical protein
MDCTEFPCIAYGEGVGTREQLEQLVGSAAMDAYAKDSAQSFGFKLGARQSFCLAFIPPRKKPPGQPSSARVRFRIKQMQQALTP